MMLRAAWVVQAPVGCLVTPAMWTRRVSSSRPERGRCLHVDRIDRRTKHDEHTSAPASVDHRPVRVAAEAAQPQAPRRGPRGDRRDVAQPGGAVQLDGLRPQGREVGPARPYPEDVRAHGGCLMAERSRGHRR